MTETKQEEVELNNVKASKTGRTVLKKEELNKSIENIDTASGKIVIEDGVNFLKQLKAEAKRQSEIKSAVLTDACKNIEELQMETTDPELDRLADSMEIIEEDDD